MFEGWHLLVYLLAPLTVLVIVAVLVARAAGKHRPPDDSLPTRDDVVDSTADSNEPAPGPPRSDG